MTNDGSARYTEDGEHTIGFMAGDALVMPAGDLADE